VLALRGTKIIAKINTQSDVIVCITAFHAVSFANAFFVRADAKCKGNICGHPQQWG
jgi:hypothetical protein